MAVDTDSFILNAKNDLKYKEVFDGLYYTRSQIPEIKGSGRYAGIKAGLVTLTNATIDGFEPDQSEDGRYSNLCDREHYKERNWRPRFDVERRKKKIIRTIQEQKQVYGNWFFIDKQTDDQGQLKMETALPIKPTTWSLTTFAIGENNGFCMAAENMKIVTKSEPTSGQLNDDIEFFKTKSHRMEFMVDHYEDGSYERFIDIELPISVEPVEISISVKDNLFGAIIANLKQYAGKMYCTGHLHMTTMMPNIVVLEYLDQTKQLDSELALSIKTRFPNAFEREQSERLEREGSFTWFCTDDTGSPHVTSLVLQAFQRASKYVNADSKTIERGLAYLANTQLESGEIKKEENPYFYPFGQNNGIGLTAIVLLAFLQAEEVKEQYKSTIDKAFEYIVGNIESANCVYDLALAFYAMQLTSHPYAGTLKERLFHIAKTNPLKTEIWWSYSLEINPEEGTYHPISDLEITSYILLGLLETENIAHLVPIIKWMLPLRELRSESMEFSIALGAILKMAVKCGASLGVIQVNYTAVHEVGEYVGKFSLTPENARKILIHKLPKTTKHVAVSTSDIGSVSFYITSRYKE